MEALIIAESTPKLMRLAGLARSTAADYRWRTATTGPLGFTIDRVTKGEVRIKIRHRRHLNRLISAAAESDRLYLAMDAGARGDLLAADIAEQLLARYPDRQIYRLVLGGLTRSEFERAFAISATINSRDVDSLRVNRILTHLVGNHLHQTTGRFSGRAVVPLLAELASAERIGMARIRVRLASGLVFVSCFAPVDLVSGVLGGMHTEVPAFRVETQEVLLRPPGRYRLIGLERDGCRFLGARSVEVSRQLDRLYGDGLVGRGMPLDAHYLGHVSTELRAFGASVDESAVDAAASGLAGGDIVPVDIRCLPSQVPRPVRAVYRLVWAATLSSFAKPVTARVERASFDVGGVLFRAESFVRLSRCFDATFGLFYRCGCIEPIRDVDDVRMFGGGPFEWEAIAGSSLGLRNPGLALKAAENAGYVGLDGPEVTVLDFGRETLARIGETSPHLLDARFFVATERYLAANGFDPYELVGPWSRWSEQAARAVKKKAVAYLR